MKQSDVQHLLDATKSLREARLSISHMSPEGRSELKDTDLVSEIMSLEDTIGNQWLDARRAAAALGSIKSDRKSKSSAANGALGGRPKKVQP